MLKIIDKFEDDLSLESIAILRYFPNKDSKEARVDVAKEHKMLVEINSIPTFEVVCSPDNLANLVVGRLITEGIVTDVGEIEQVYVCEQGSLASVILKNSSRADFSKQTIEKVQSCCTSNKTLNSYFELTSETLEVQPIKWSLNWMFEMANYFRNDSPAHKKSYGTHSCYITWKNQDFSKGSPLVCEDLGRHNAFDKVVGKAILAGLDLKECMVFTSGRLPVDMVIKAVRAKIPILASKAVPTTEALALANKSKLTLICSAYPDAFDVYTDFANM